MQVLNTYFAKFQLKIRTQGSIIIRLLLLFFSLGRSPFKNLKLTEREQRSWNDSEVTS